MKKDNTKIYRNFNDAQKKYIVGHLHSRIHKLLIYKDVNVKEKPFADNEEFLNYFHETLIYSYSFNNVSSNNLTISDFILCLEMANSLLKEENFKWVTYRRCILNAHNCLSTYEKEVG